MTTQEQLIAAADALDVRRKLMQTEVPLSNTARIVENSQATLPHLVRQGSGRKPNVIMAATYERRPRKEMQIELPDRAKLSPTPTTPLDLPCPPPTRSVTPMLSLYATVKVSNIRMAI